MKRQRNTLYRRWMVLIFTALCVLMPARFAMVYAAADETISSAESLKGSGLYSEINELSEYRAEHGLKNLEPHSIYLLRKGIKAYKEKRKKEAILYFGQAIELSPDLPAPYLYLAKINFSISPKGLYSASAYLFKALIAVKNNFWWLLQSLGIFFITLLSAVYISMFVLLIIIACSKFQLYIHDIIEDKKKLIFLLPSLVLALFGPIFVLIGFMFPFLPYLKKKEKDLLYTVIGTSILIILILPLYSSFLSASQDRTLKEIVKINEGIYTGESSKLSVKANSYESVFAYALYLKRNGRYKEAISLYKELLKQGENAKIYNNIANCYIGLGMHELATENYNKALKLKGMASTYYNLSQQYREVFKFDDAEKYYQAAVKIDSNKVDFYNTVKGVSVNRFVMDETLSTRELLNFGFRKSTNDKPKISLSGVFSFTNRILSIFLLVLLIAGIYFFDRYFSYGAYKCRRCGKIFCSNCERRLSHDDVCIKCFRTLVEVSELGPKDRIGRILDIQRYREKKNNRLKILTLLFPGSGHIYFGWSLKGLMIMLSFTFFLSSVFFWNYMPVPLSMNETVSFFSGASIIGLLFVYGIVAQNILRRTPRKWL